MSLTYEPHLLRLSDDIILIIMSYLKLPDIYSVAQVCTRLEKISKDRTLWKKADLRPMFLSREELEQAARYCHHGTKVLASTGPVQVLCKKADGASTSSSSSSEHTECLTPALFELVTNQATSLETLILEHHVINASVLGYRCFPTSLKHLSMENCRMINAPAKESYFFNMASQTPDLVSLNLSGSTWFEDHSMMAISKCPNLKTLRLRGCPKVGTCPAYIFLSARFGFEQIEVLDLRETSVSDAEVRSFKSKPFLRRLYLDGRLHRRMGNDEQDRVSDTGLNLPEEPASQLEVLAVTNTEVTDVTLRHVARNMPKLKLIDLRGSRVTEAGVARLKTESPNLRILSDYDNQPSTSKDDSNGLSSIPDDWLIDREFVRQEEIQRPVIVVTPGAAEAGPSRHERIEIVTVEPGIVRLRRVFDPAPPAPIIPQEAQPEASGSGLVEQPRARTPQPQDEEAEAVPLLDDAPVVPAESHQQQDPSLPPSLGNDDSL